MTISLLLGTLFLVLCLLTEVRCLCTTPQVDAGTFFTCHLERDAFFQLSPPQADVDVVQVSVSLQDNAGPPDWVRWLPENRVLPVILYGTPVNSDIGQHTLLVRYERVVIANEYASAMCMRVLHVTGYC